MTKLWRNEFANNVTAEDKVQLINLNQFKFKVNDTYKKDRKNTTHSEPIDNSDVINKAQPDRKIPKKEGHISDIGKNYNEF